MVAPALSPSASLRLPLIAAHLRRLRPTSIVEVGCGQGAMAFRLARRFDYRGYEPDPISFAKARRHLDRLGRGTVLNAPLPDDPDRSFDLLVAFEVLEHLEDDLAALRSWSTWVRPGGGILLSTPAHPERFGPSDVAAGHYRRYTRPGLENVMAEAGLETQSIEIWGMPLGYLLEWGRHTYLGRSTAAGGDKATSTAGSGRLLQPPAWLGAVVEVVVSPFTLLQHPFRGTDYGIGYVALATVRR